MLRFRILASTVPLLVAGLLAGEQLVASVHPCITTADASVELAELPWQAARLVSFTADPARATVRVQLVDDPTLADFTVVDDGRTGEEGACSGHGPTRFVAVRDGATPAPTVIYLSREERADYRIYVRSKSFSPQDAAALIVGARSDETVTGSL